MNESLKPQSDARLVRSLLLPVAILVVSIVAWFVVTRTQTAVPPVTQPPPVEVNRTKEFYDSTLQPWVDENRQANLVDWWMTDNFKATLETDLNKYLTHLHDGIIEGVNGQSGLRPSLQNFCADCNNAQDATFRQMLLGESR